MNSSSHFDTVRDAMRGEGSRSGRGNKPAEEGDRSGDMPLENMASKSVEDYNYGDLHHLSDEQDADQHFPYDDVEVADETTIPGYDEDVEQHAHMNNHPQDMLGKLPAGRSGRNPMLRVVHCSTSGPSSEFPGAQQQSVPSNTASSSSPMPPPPPASSQIYRRVSVGERGTKNHQASTTSPGPRAGQQYNYGYDDDDERMVLNQQQGRGGIVGDGTTHGFSSSLAGAGTSRPPAAGQGVLSPPLPPPPPKRGVAHGHERGMRDGNDVNNFHEDTMARAGPGPHPSDRPPTRMKQFAQIPTPHTPMLSKENKANNAKRHQRCCHAFLAIFRGCGLVFSSFIVALVLLAGASQSRLWKVKIMGPLRHKFRNFLMDHGIIRESFENFGSTRDNYGTYFGDEEALDRELFPQKWLAKEKENSKGTAKKGKKKKGSAAGSTSNAGVDGATAATSSEAAGKTTGGAATAPAAAAEVTEGGKTAAKPGKNKKKKKKKTGTAAGSDDGSQPALSKSGDQSVLQTKERKTARVQRQQRRKRNYQKKNKKNSGAQETVGESRSGGKVPVEEAAGQESSKTSDEQLQDAGFPVTAPPPPTIAGNDDTFGGRRLTNDGSGDRASMLQEQHHSPAVKQKTGNNPEGDLSVTQIGGSSFSEKELHERPGHGHGRGRPEILPDMGEEENGSATAGTPAVPPPPAAPQANVEPAALKTSSPQHPDSSIEPEYDFVQEREPLKTSTELGSGSRKQENDDPSTVMEIGKALDKGRGAISQSHAHRAKELQEHHSHDKNTDFLAPEEFEKGEKSKSRRTGVTTVENGAPAAGTSTGLGGIGGSAMENGSDFSATAGASSRSGAVGAVGRASDSASGPNFAVDEEESTLSASMLEKLEAERRKVKSDGAQEDVVQNPGLENGKTGNAQLSVEESKSSSVQLGRTETKKEVHEASETSTKIKAEEKEEKTALKVDQNKPSATEEEAAAVQEARSGSEPPSPQLPEQMPPSENIGSTSTGNSAAAAAASTLQAGEQNEEKKNLEKNFYIGGQKEAQVPLPPPGQDRIPVGREVDGGREDQRLDSRLSGSSGSSAGSSYMETISGERMAGSEKGESGAGGRGGGQVGEEDGKVEGGSGSMVEVGKEKVTSASQGLWLQQKQLQEAQQAQQLAQQQPQGNPAGPIPIASAAPPGAAGAAPRANSQPPAPQHQQQLQQGAAAAAAHSGPQVAPQMPQHAALPQPATAVPPAPAAAAPPASAAVPPPATAAAAPPTPAAAAPPTPAAGAPATSAATPKQPVAPRGVSQQQAAGPPPPNEGSDQAEKMRQMQQKQFQVASEVHKQGLNQEALQTDVDKLQDQVHRVQRDLKAHKNQEGPSISFAQTTASSPTPTSNEAAPARPATPIERVSGESAGAEYGKRSADGRSISTLEERKLSELQTRSGDRRLAGQERVGGQESAGGFSSQDVSSTRSSSSSSYMETISGEKIVRAADEGKKEGDGGRRRAEKIDGNGERGGARSVLEFGRELAGEKSGGKPALTVTEAANGLGKAAAAVQSDPALSAVVGLTPVGPLVNGIAAAQKVSEAMGEQDQRLPGPVVFFFFIALILISSLKRGNQE
ncbi:unnamed protein product [Amoebophrya sp. A120]|nr:unnamed protein product [Amoebophrya sp. A120]|eukprot:GSA120T00015965001.1